MFSQALRNIPKTKLEQILSDLPNKVEDPIKLATIKKVYHRYYEANIPIKYWKLEMLKHFDGDKNALRFYNDIVFDIPETYKSGKLICLAGKYGRGKTMMVTNILKRALEKGYTGLYVTLTDIVSAMKSPEAFVARKELLLKDFLVIDELDPRYMGTEAASDFYGRMLEDVLRNRAQNTLPIFFCSNSPDPRKAFSGSLHESISSLFNYVDVYPVLGRDKRIEEGVHG